jgi:serine/threonine-protein kinase RsbT
MGMPANEMSVPVNCEIDIVKARQLGRSFSSSRGFSATDQTVVAAIISDLARSILVFAGYGEVILRLMGDRGNQGILIWARYGYFQTLHIG